MNICDIDTDRCTGCGACVETCPHEALALHDGVAQLEARLCRGCGTCVDVCPVGAITLTAPSLAVQLAKAGLPAAILAAQPARARLSVPGVTEYVAIPASHLGRVPAGRDTSLLSRLANALVPAALSLAASFGEAWLSRSVDRVPGGVSAPDLGRCGQPPRRRARRRGRS